MAAFACEICICRWTRGGVGPPGLVIISARNWLSHTPSHSDGVARKSRRRVSELEMLAWAVRISCGVAWGIPSYWMNRHSQCSGDGLGGNCDPVRQDQWLTRCGSVI